MLNPELFRALKRLNKGVDPKISNPGVRYSFTVRTENGKPKLDGYGEQYAINCPNPGCNDKRSRLYVHYMYGQRHHIPGYNSPGDQLLGLAYCQNEQKRIRLQGYLEGFYTPADPRTAETLAALDGVLQTKKRVCPSMGAYRALETLPEEHPAVQYLVGRGYSPRYLGETCKAVLLEGHPDPIINRMASGRIGFPFYVNGELLAWQARSAYDLPKGKKWPPKWWFPGGIDKVPWNVDVAAQFPVVVLCEGILSAVNAGPAAIAVCGKTITGPSMAIIKQRWTRAIVMLDSDAGINRKPGEIDYHERMLTELKEAGIEAQCVRWTPGDLRDPGELGFVGCVEVLRTVEFSSLLSYVKAA